MINLTKGQRINLTKKEDGITRLNVGLGWDENRGLFGFGEDIDCDASCICLDENDKPIKKAFREAVVYFGNKKLPGITHSGDNLTGGGEGDDETIEIDFSKLLSNVSKIPVFMNIYKAKERKQNFSKLKNAYIRVYNPLTKEELCRFNLDDSMETASALIAGEIYKKDGEWKFAATGEAIKGDGYVTDVTSRWGLDGR